MGKMNVLLAYVSYPATTAAYIEKALRQVAHVKTIGPQLPKELLLKWNLENLKEPILEQNISVDMNVDMLKVDFSKIDFIPDLYLWVESVPGYYPMNLDKLKCPKACYLIDTYVHHEWHIRWASQFDYVFLADYAFVDKFRSNGINAHWLPLGCDPQIHVPDAKTAEYDVGFIGTIQKDSYRHITLEKLATQYSLNIERLFLKDMANSFGKSKMIFNTLACPTALNMRFYEVLSCGILLLNDYSSKSCQDVMFEPHFEYAPYEDRNLFEVVDYYLKDDLARNTVAQRGQDIAWSAHTYLHRVNDLLNVVLAGKKSTYSPEELRCNSISNIKNKIKNGSESPETAQFTYIIPVLDYAPASQYNIKTLLDDLADCGGEVIIIFNSEIIAQEIKNHPRINKYVVMKENVGVSRAWNVGLELCETQYAFILNSDLKISKQVILQLHNAIKILPNAAIVGPEGTYFNFHKMNDYQYFGKGQLGAAMEVDAVAGFLFCVNTDYFKNKALKFEIDYSPCYFEEWDLGLQIKQAGLKAYAVPVLGYDHQWSGSIRSYRQISYLGKLATAKQLQLRNGHLFRKKWLDIAKESNNPNLLISKFRDVLIRQIQLAEMNNDLDHAKKVANVLADNFPDDHEFVNNC